MLAAVFFGIGIWILYVISGITEQNHDLIRLYRSREMYMQVVALAEGIEQYYREVSTLPASLPALNARAGFEHTRAAINSWQGYAVSPTLSDGVWQYTRAVLFLNDPTSGTTPAAYLAANWCGSGGYDTAASWCGSPQSRWFRRESRETYNEMIGTQRARLRRLLQKFSDYYNVNGKFPDKDNLGASLAANSMTAVKTLAAYGGSANNCTGTFTYMGVPVDCSDMYDLWGGAVGYQFVSSARVILVSESPIFNNTGARVVVSAEYDLSLL